MTLAKNIRYLRKNHEWSQEFVAEKLGYKSYDVGVKSLSIAP